MLSTIGNFVSGARKAVAAAVGLLLTVLTFVHPFASILPPPISTYVGIAFAIVTVLATYVVPNKPKAA